MSQTRRDSTQRDHPRPRHRNGISRHRSSATSRNPKTSHRCRFLPRNVSTSAAKAIELGLENLEFLQVDIETVDFPQEGSDRIFSCTVPIYLTDIPTALSRWYRWLKPGEKLLTTGFSRTCFVINTVLIEIAKRYGVSLLSPNEATATETQCRTLLQAARFQDLEIHRYQFGEYLAPEILDDTLWKKTLEFPFNRPLMQLLSEAIAPVKQDFFAEVKVLTTDRGIWNEITTFLISGTK